MKMKKYISVAAIVLFYFGTDLKAQCSDAGVCSLSDHLEEFTPHKFNLGIGYGFGYSGKNDEVSYHSVTLSGSYKVLENTSISFHLPYNSQSGPLGDVNGIGDLIIGASREFRIDHESGISVSAGVKLATGDENKEPELPQAYQSGLGSNDILLGAQYHINDFRFGIGYQIAGGRNDNILTELERGDDLLIQGGYRFTAWDLSFNPQLLVIKRLGESSIIDLSSSKANSYVDIPDSDQLQINFLLNTQYSLSSQNSLVFEFAFPFLKRNVNVDGLTRALSASVGYSWSF